MWPRKKTKIIEAENIYEVRIGHFWFVVLFHNKEISVLLTIFDAKKLIEANSIIDKFVTKHVHYSLKY
jgi:hypothetical protein